MTDRPTVPSQLAVRSSQSVVGTARRKVDATAKVTGETKYADDLPAPHALVQDAAVARAARARIIRIDTSRAETYPGVVAVLTGRDLPIPFGILPISRTSTRSAPTACASWATR